MGLALVTGAARPASAATDGAQRFTIVFAGPDGEAGRVLAAGVIHGAGSNPASQGDQVLIFQEGTLFLSTELTGGSGGYNPTSCIGRGTSTGTFVVTGGTGQLQGATGSGTFSGTGATMARHLPGGGCSETEVYRHGVVHITGTISLGDQPV